MLCQKLEAICTFLLFLCSSISSTLNSAAAIVYEDFLRPLPYFDRMSDAGQVEDLRYAVSKYL